MMMTVRPFSLPRIKGEKTQQHAHNNNMKKKKRAYFTQAPVQTQTHHQSNYQ